MFNIKRPEKISLKVGVRIPGVREEHRFTAHFRYLDMAERKAFIERLADADGSLDDIDVARELMVGWDDVKQPDGKPLAFSDTALETLMNIPYARDAIVNVVMRDVLGGAFVRKN